MHVVQYLRVVCQNSSPPPRHSPRSEYLCNRKDSTDAENRERGGQSGGGRERKDNEVDGEEGDEWMKGR